MISSPTDFTFMLVESASDMAGGYGVTGQLKSFPTREQAEVAADNLSQVRADSVLFLQVIKLYV
jgi:hypothetical protein